MPSKIKTEKDFWNNVDKSGGPDACWLWISFVRYDGFGHAKVNKKTYSAHRFSYLSFYKESPQLIVHSCNNKLCCNPKHMKGVSQKERPWRKNTTDDFWKKHRKTKQGCWEWTGQINHNGYGIACFNGTTVRAHRFSYFLKNNKWPTIVMHTCDNRRCINPEHLRGGTQKENIKDCLDKGRFHHQIREKNNAQ